MNTLIKFLSIEAIENCVTCLNYCFEKVVFFAYKDSITEESINITSFLKNDCEIKSVKYIEIDNCDLNSIIEKIDKVINNKEHIYFDLTGAEGLCEVAFCNVAYSKQIPMFIYDIRNNVVLNIDNKIKGSIKDVKRRKININIKSYIRMVGGVVIDSMHKGNKDIVNDKLLAIKHKYNDIWSNFSYCMQQCKSKDLNKPLYCECYSIRKLIKVLNGKVTRNQLVAILNDLYKATIINKFNLYEDNFSFYYVDYSNMNNIVDAGAILEQEVYEIESKTADDCMIGVHLDWDGIVSRSLDGNVFNEIDVLRLDGYVLTFISCKNTKRIDKNALYELEAITRRFGSKYSKMKLVTDIKPSLTDINRAKLIGIEIVCVND